MAMKIVNKFSVVILHTSFFMQLLQLQLQVVTCAGLPTSSSSNICDDFHIQIVTNKLPSSFRIENGNGNGLSSNNNGDRNKQKLYYEQKGKLLSQVVATNSEFALIMYGPDPIEWVYEGPGQPFDHSATMERSKSGCYVIRMVRLPNMEFKAENTGRYTVRSVNSPDKKESAYLYMPNKYPPFLLNTERLQSVDWQEGKPLVLPCLLNDPRVKVTLSKRVGLNEWQEASNVGTYSPQTGFTIKKPFNGATTLYGSYKCSTSLHNRNDTVFMYVAPPGY